jgi:Q-cell neuroblast polarisation
MPRGVNSSDAPLVTSWLARCLGIAALIALIALGSFARIHTALVDPNFDRVHAEGMLKSDPGLLYYFTERILESGGLPPADFRADPRVEYPLTTDIPAMFPVGQEFVVAWSYRLFGAGMPLHVFCVWAMGIFAALCALGVYGLALELTSSVGWACFAAALYTLLPANYRTIGFILVGEDFSFPWFVLHLWLLARAARFRTSASIVLAAVSLGIALSTWHALSFFFTLEAVSFFAWFLRSDENPFAVERTRLFPATLAIFALLVPVLKSTLFLFSLPMQWIGGMLAVACLPQARDLSRKYRSVAACAIAALLLLAAFGLSKAMGGGWTDYSHVFGLLWQKLIHLGQLPADPRELPFEVRLMWQGPFDTLDLSWGIRQLGVATVFIAPAVCWIWRDWRSPASQSERGRNSTMLCTLLVISLPVAWLIERTILLPGILLPVIAACSLQIIRRPATSIGLALGLLAIQACFFASFLDQHQISWYRPPQRQREIAGLVARIPRLVPAGAPIASDFMNSTAILAHTRHPIVLQPKYEFRRSRERAERFLRAFFEGTPEDLRRLVVDEFQCRHLLIDRFTLGILSRYAAGIPRAQTELAPGSAATVFLSQEASVLESVPGYRLLYRSPAGILQSDGSSTDFFRLYELAP